MRKVQSSKFKVQIFLAAVAIALFVAPATASAAPTASIRADQNDTFTATANGTNLTKIDIYRTPTGYASWTYMGTGSCSGSSCTYSVTWDPTSTGTRDWYIVVNAFDATGQCTGSPFAFGPSWSSCGANGYTGMTPPTATNPAGSCPIPGTTASLSWSGASGASRYDVYAFDLAYGSPNWSSACGSNGRVVCSQVTSTSYSFSTTAGNNYQWYVFACNGWGCSAPASYSTTFTCTPAPTPPTPTVSANPVCTPGDTSSMYTISWSSTSPAISYVDISTDPNFGSWWNKYVGGATSTSASSGFNAYTGVSGSLTLQPNTTYYVRSWNGYRVSGTATFTTPGTCTCSGYNWIDAPTGGTTYTTGTNYTSSGWSTFCSGPNGTNRNRVDPYVCDTNGGNCKYIGPSSSSVRQDVVNLAWTCGNLNPNSDGWYFSFTPDTTMIGAKNLSVASINDSAATCVKWETTSINIVAPVPPTPSVSASPVCTPGDTSSMYTISWASASPAVTYVDISSDPNFGSWYNKYVGGTTSTSVSSGFNLYPGGTTPLVLQPNTTYYVRLWNGYRNDGGRATFTTPNGCPPSAPTNPAGSCPIPGTTANFSWTGVSGANRYDLYAFDLAYGSPNWSSACGSNGRVVCQRVYDTSYSATNLTPGSNYQWFVFACNDYACSSAPASYSTTFTCIPPPAPPTPTVSASPVCTPTDTGSMYTISWANTSPAITYVDISSDPNFGSWYNKYVGGSTSTTATSGFNGYTPSGASGPLTLQPNTTYYVRSWNGYRVSGTASFTTPVSCTCDPTKYNWIDAPTEGTTYTMGNAYTSSGWSTFCSGPNGTNRDRVDPYVCDQGTWNNCKYIGPTSSYVRQDVVNLAWTCGNLNPNSDGWTFSFTPDSTMIGAKTLAVASINDSATTCVVWDARNVNIVAPTPPTPTAVVNSSCTSGDTSNDVTISWASSNPAITYIDISENNFATWYNKYVGGSTSTTASSGFNAFTPSGASGPLTLKPNTTYSVRAWNGYTLSGTSTFTTPKLCPPTNPTASCPVPGTTASLSWIGVSGASRYDVYVQDLAYGSLNWNTAQCGQNGLVVCDRVPGTSYSANNLTPGANYQWYVFACVGEGSNCSDPASYSTTFTCIPAPISPTPTVTPNLSCTPVDTGISSNMYTISWTNNPSTPVTWVDISTNNFATWYNKYVAGTTSTSASSGFGGDGTWGVTGPLTLQPNTTYYVRTYNGYNNSGTTTFTTPSRCPPPTASITGPLSALIDQSLTYSAQIVNAGSGTIFVTRSDNNTFTCPPGIFTDSTGRNWCIIGTLTNGNFNGSTFSAAFTPRESGVYVVIVNAYANTTADFTADKTTECTGNPFGLNPTQQAQWSDCGPNDNITTNVDRTPAPPPTTNCGGGVSPRAEGLVTTPTLQTGSKFGTSTTGRCVVNDSTIEFKPFKIPTYDDLKSIYYTQSKATKIQSSSQNLNPTTSQDDGKVFNYTAADVSVNSAAPYAGTAVIFIDGNLNIDKDITTSDRTKGLVLVVKNNVNIDVGVKQIDAVIMSAGKIYTAGANCPTSNVPATNALIVNGSLISLDTGAIVFCRTLTNNSQAAERIYQQPKYLVILRSLFADTLQKWSEIP